MSSACADMQWKCKSCEFQAQSQSVLLKHYKLKHGCVDRFHRQPCLYLDCPCSFRTWNALKSHLSRCHPTYERTGSTSQSISFSCHICDCCNIGTDKEFFEHICTHLKNNETVPCVFKLCQFETNIYGTFASHKSRKHKPFEIQDFKHGIVIYSDSSEKVSELVQEDTSSNFETVDDTFTETSSNSGLESEATTPIDAGNAIELQLARLLLKLENVHHISCVAIDELLVELKSLLHCASVPAVQSAIHQTFSKEGCPVEGKVVQELAESICRLNPVILAIEKPGPLSSHHRRKLYFKENFGLVEPVEYFLDDEHRCSFQYVPLLGTLQRLFEDSTILQDVLVGNTSHEGEDETENVKYRTYRDGKYYKANELFAESEFSICLSLYVDDFEVCNPLGTSRKKHKICGIYWVLANLPSKVLSTLTSINLAVLCKSNDVRTFGYQKVLGPLLRDIAELEQDGIFIPSLGKNVKGSVICVIADNLGAHSLAGFVESFSACYVCRYCTGELSDFQTKEVRAGLFQARTKDDHSRHIQSLKDNPSVKNVCGVKRTCPLTSHLQYFHAVTGYPPDILHDLLEGVVPRELALCLQLLISKGYFTFNTLNENIRCFPYKEVDKTNSPQPLSKQSFCKRTVGGNAHENWCLLRLLPFIIGKKVPSNEPAWEILMNLKDIVELTVSPVHSEESICYLDWKIAEHRHLFQTVFPSEKLLPKHHFLEHYPELIRSFGPLTSVWTMRFEAKHSFFKQVVRHSGCFKNILLTLATKHQLMMAYHFPYSKSPLEVASVSAINTAVLSEEIVEPLKQKHGSLTEIHLAKRVCYYGTVYKVGMILSAGSLGGLPCFFEIIYMVIIDNRLNFLVKQLQAWYIEHLRSYELDVFPIRSLAVLDPSELADHYPLTAYVIGGRRMVTLKRYIHHNV